MYLVMCRGKEVPFFERFKNCIFQLTQDPILQNVSKRIWIFYQKLTRDNFMKNRIKMLQMTFNKLHYI